MEELCVETIEYRGYKVDILCNDAGQCFYCTLDGEEINFGTYNTEYEEDLKYLIDCKLDVITRFNEFPGAQLMWFDNSGYWDIKLVYRERILKIWVIKDRESFPDTSITKLISEAAGSLTKYLAAAAQGN